MCHKHLAATFIHVMVAVVTLGSASAFPQSPAAPKLAPEVREFVIVDEPIVALTTFVITVDGVPTS